MSEQQLQRWLTREDETALTLSDLDPAQADILASVALGVFPRFDIVVEEVVDAGPVSLVVALEPAKEPSGVQLEIRERGRGASLLTCG